MGKNGRGYMTMFNRALFSLAVFSTAQGVKLDCPKDFEAYSTELNPFGWPLTPAGFNYDRPDCWVQKYPSCNVSSHRQSPLGINRIGGHRQFSEGTDSLELRVSYKSVTDHPVLRVSKYMRAVALDGNLGGIWLKENGKDVLYQGTRAFLTTRALHTDVFDFEADAELLIVHKAAHGRDGSDGSVIVSVRFEVSSTGNSELFHEMGLDKKHESATWKGEHTIDLNTVLKTAAKGSFATYAGSIPVPPCTENVRYFLFRDVLSVGEVQVRNLEHVLLQFAGGTKKRSSQKQAPLVLNKLDVDTARINCDAEPSKGTAACLGHGEASCLSSPVNVSGSDSSRQKQRASDILEYTTGEEMQVLSVKRTPTAVAVYGDFGTLNVNGRVLRARKMSVRAVAQHEFGGMRNAGELIIEHTPLGDFAHARHLAVDEDELGEDVHIADRVMVSIPLKIGSTSPLLSKIGLTTENQAAIRDDIELEVSATLNLKELLRKPLANTWYWYDGTDTSEVSCQASVVHWMLFRDALEVDLQQLNVLETELSGFDSALPLKAIANSDVKNGWVPSNALTGGGRFTGDGGCTSPVSIKTSQVATSGALRLISRVNWKPVSGLLLENTGEHFGISNSQLGYATMIGKNGLPDYYQVTNMILRTPSEHMLNGKHYRLELQVVHHKQRTVLSYDSEDAFIVSVFFDEGSESKFFKQLLAGDLPSKDHYTTVQGPMDLMWAFGPSLDDEFYTYTGSYTSGTCPKGAVRWALLSRPLEMSRSQIDKIRKVFPAGNHRPLVELDNRPVGLNTLSERTPVEHDYFLTRTEARDKDATLVGYIAFPIIGTVLLCLVTMTAVFQSEDRQRKLENAGGLSTVPLPNSAGARCA